MTDKPTPRIEDGSIQFGSDWPGIFFRGDTAFHFGSHLGAVLESLERGEFPNGIAIAVLRGLHSDLLSVSVHVVNDARQFLKSAQDCLLVPAPEADQRTIVTRR